MDFLQFSFLLILFCVAFLYASVGHGGASGYLALMAIYNFAPEEMRSSALLLNLFVSLISFYQFFRKGYFQWRLFYPFAIASIPMAFVGANIETDVIFYKQVLGVLIIFPVMRMFGFLREENSSVIPNNLFLSIALGGAIGLFSGMIGIGGGILLSPLILMLGWANMKQTAATSALFIFVNSASGIIGLISQEVVFLSNSILWTSIAFLGGMLGAYYSSFYAQEGRVKIILGFTLLLASVKLLFF